MSGLRPEAGERESSAAGWRAGVPACALILAVLAVRLVYLAWWCPYNLIEDEAHYWEWSRRLDWSYYSKGPGIAVLIRLGTWLFGETEFGVRVVAAVSGAVTAFAVAMLAGDVAGGSRGPWGKKSGRAALYAAGMVALIPGFQLTSILTTIDGPYLACWALACWFGWRAMGMGRGWAWPALGAAIAAGFLVKYTILLAAVGLIAFAVVYGRRARGAWRASKVGERGSGRGRRLVVPILAGLVIACAGLIPVMVWNAERDWPTVRHLMGHLGMRGGDMPVVASGAPRGFRYEWNWTADFLGSQFGIVGVALLLMIAAAWRAWKTRREDEGAWIGRAFLILCGAPILVFYLLLTAVSEGEGNWPIAGYVSLAALTGVMLPGELERYRGMVRRWMALPGRPRPKQGWLRRKPETAVQMFWHFSLVYGVVVGVVGLRLDWLATLPGVGPRVPVGRMIGASERAEHVAELMEGLRERTGLEPFAAAQHYGRASQLAFYLPGRPAVVCTSSVMGGRRTQYDHWPETRVDDPGLIGRPAVCVGALKEQWEPWFAVVEPIGSLRGETKKGRETFVGIGFRGREGEAGGKER